MSNNFEQVIEGEIVQIIDKQQELVTLERELMQNEQFRQFLNLKKTVDEQADILWKTVESHMIERNIKSVKGDWGSVTIAERLNWDTTDELPSKFYVKKVDTKKLSDTYRLEGKAPKGATPYYTNYLTKRIK